MTRTDYPAGQRNFPVPAGDVAGRGAPGPLRLRGDWGGANLTRVCGWLAQWLWVHTEPHRYSVIHTGRGMGDNLRALAAGETDVAVITPASFAALARAGRGPFAGQPMPQLRALGQLPHRDAMLLAVRADLGVHTLRDLRRRPGVRLAAGASDRDGFMGFAASLVLDAGGLSLDAIRAAGGRVRHHEDPFGCLDDLSAGQVDAVLTEAVMTAAWHEAARAVPLAYVSLDDKEINAITGRWPLAPITLPAGYLPGMTTATTTLDYSGWLVVTTAALPGPLAASLAEAIADDAATLEAQYRHLPIERSPLTYPISLDRVSATAIPLHQAAADVYHARQRS